MSRGLVAVLAVALLASSAQAAVWPARAVAINSGTQPNLVQIYDSNANLIESLDFATSSPIAQTGATPNLATAPGATIGGAVWSADGTYLYVSTFHGPATVAPVGTAAAVSVYAFEAAFNGTRSVTGTVSAQAAGTVITVLPAATAPYTAVGAVAGDATSIYVSYVATTVQARTLTVGAAGALTAVAANTATATSPPQPIVFASAQTGAPPPALSALAATLDGFLYYPATIAGPIYTLRRVNVTAPGLTSPDDTTFVPGALANVAAGTLKSIQVLGARTATSTVAYNTDGAIYTLNPAAPGTQSPFGVIASNLRYYEIAFPTTVGSTAEPTIVWAARLLSLTGTFTTPFGAQTQLVRASWTDVTVSVNNVTSTGDVTSVGPPIVTSSTLNVPTFLALRPGIPAPPPAPVATPPPTPAAAPPTPVAATPPPSPVVVGTPPKAASPPPKVASSPPPKPKRPPPKKKSKRPPPKKRRRPPPRRRRRPPPRKRRPPPRKSKKTVKKRGF